MIASVLNSPLITMSRGSNRNKVNGPNAKKSTKGTSGDSSSLVYIALAAIITVALCMLLFLITSSSSFKGALTMTGPQIPAHNTGPLHFQPQKKKKNSTSRKPQVKNNSSQQQSASQKKSPSVHNASDQANDNTEFSPVFMAKSMADSTTLDVGSFILEDGRKILLNRRFFLPKMDGKLFITVKDKDIGDAQINNAGFEWSQNKPVPVVQKGEKVIEIRTFPNISSLQPEHITLHHPHNSPFTVETNVEKVDSYFYFDSNTDSFRLKDNYAVFPAKPVKATLTNGQFDTTFQSHLALSGKYLPSLCKNGKSYGFSDLATLRSAINELGSFYAYAVERQTHYLKAMTERLNLEKSNPNYYIEEAYELPQYMKDYLNLVPDPFVICPQSHLKPLIHERVEPIYINAEDLIIQCEDYCVIDAPGTHMEFGPYSKNVLIKGLTFAGATDTSVVFREDGSVTTFEDCYFFHNAGQNAHGSVMDVNSTSSVELSRCEINEYSDKGGGTHQPHTLTLRAKANT